MLVSSLFQLSFVVAALWPNTRTQEHKNTSVSSLLDKNFTTTIKAVCCFIVMLSHIGLNEKYQLLGCFHWIAVSFFFLFSGFGLTVSTLTKPDYLKFFYKRFFKVLIPYAAVLFINYCFNFPIGSIGIFYVNVILLFYAMYYVIHRFIKKNPDIFVCIFIVLYSLFIQFYVDSRVSRENLLSYFGWANQSIAFIYGIVIAKKLDYFKKILFEKRILIFCICILLISTLTPLYISRRNIYYISWAQYFLRIILVSAFILCIFVITQNMRLGNKIILYIVNLSYYIFLLQGVVIKLIQKLQLYDKLQPSFIVILICVLTFLLSILFSHIVLFFTFCSKKFLNRVRR